MPQVKREQLAVDGGAMPYTLVLPDGDAAVPLLVVVPSIFGVNDDLLRQMSELAEVGGVAALDPFWRVEPGPIAYDQAPRAFERLNQLDRVASYRDFVALLEALRQHPRCSGKVASLGICFGGPFCLLAAADGLVDGVITWHGSRMHQYVDRAADMRCPMVHHIGGADTLVPPDSVAVLRQAFAGRDDVELVIHDGAGHGFSQPGATAHDAGAERAAMATARRMLLGLAGWRP